MQPSAQFQGEHIKIPCHNRKIYIYLYSLPRTFHRFWPCGALASWLAATVGKLEKRGKGVAAVNFKTAGWWIHPAKKHVGLFYSHLHTHEQTSELIGFLTRQNFYFLIHKLYQELLRCAHKHSYCIHRPALKGPVCRILNTISSVYHHVKLSIVVFSLPYNETFVSKEWDKPTPALSTDFPLNLQPCSLKYLKSDTLDL